MDPLISNEMRLVYALALNAAVFIAAWRFIHRRLRQDWLDTTGDAFLLFYLIQYLSVALCGLAGILSPWTLGLAALAMSAGLMILGRPGGSVTPFVRPRVAIGAVACLGFVLGYIIGMIFIYRHMPVLSNDALTYHVPAAAQWLQTGHLGLFETWFFNPANTWSPLAGSTFICWLLAPLGNDLLASFVQIGPLIMLWFVAVQVIRRAGFGSLAAAVLATGITLCRPFVHGALMTKDDLFVVVFFAAALNGLSGEKINDALGPWRVGTALGLLLAMKYTALPAAALLLIMADSPWRFGWRWRQWSIAGGCVVLLAGPWYLRNTLLTGNPLFPVTLEVGGVTLLGGLFVPTVSTALRSWHGIRHAMLGVDDALPIIGAVILAAGWLGALVSSAWWRRPLHRMVVLGPVAGIALFLWKSPYPEIRFLYPVLLMLGVGCGMAIVRLADAAAAAHLLRAAGKIIELAVAAVVAIFLIVSGISLGFFVITAVLGSGAAILVFFSRKGLISLHRGLWMTVQAVMVLGLVGGIGVFWQAYVTQSRQLVDYVWHSQYGDIADAWADIRQRSTDGQTVAYTNTYLVYPLMGFDARTWARYIPTRRNVRHLRDLPRSNQPLSGEQMQRWAADVAETDPDEDQWLRDLKQAQVKWLFLAKRPGMPAPPERAFIAAHSGIFVRVFDNPAASIFEVNQ